jgi:hypothetical protein
VSNCTQRHIILHSFDVQKDARSKQKLKDICFERQYFELSAFILFSTGPRSITYDLRMNVLP